MARPPEPEPPAAPPLDSRPSRFSLARAGSWPQKLYGPGILLCAVALAVGLTAPLMAVDRLMVFGDRYSLLDVVADLTAGGEWVLAAIVFLFSAVGPTFKLGLMVRVWGWHDLRSPRCRRDTAALGVLSKWSMADVFIVAVVVVTLKLDGVLTSARLETGFYAFLTAALGSALLAHLLARSIGWHRRRLEADG